MRMYVSTKLNLRQMAVYSFLLYRQNLDPPEYPTPDYISEKLRMKKKTVETLLANLGELKLLKLTDGHLVASEPTPEFFRFTKEGFPQYYSISLSFAKGGTISDCVVLGKLSSFFKQNKTKQTAKGIAKLVGLSRRSIEPILDRLVKSEKLEIEKLTTGFKITKINIPTSNELEKPIAKPKTAKEVIVKATTAKPATTEKPNWETSEYSYLIKQVLADHSHNTKVQMAFPERFFSMSRRLKELVGFPMQMSDFWLIETIRDAKNGSKTGEYAFLILYKLKQDIEKMEVEDAKYK